MSKHNRERIGESSRARDLLQTHLVEAGREATRLRRRIRELKSNLQDKLAPVKVSLQMDRASEEKEIAGDSDSTWAKEPQTCQWGLCWLCPLKVNSTSFFRAIFPKGCSRRARSWRRVKTFSARRSGTDSGQFAGNKIFQGLPRTLCWKWRRTRRCWRETWRWRRSRSTLTRTSVFRWELFSSLTWRPS